MKKILFVFAIFGLFFLSCDENDTVIVTDDYYSICQINPDGTGYKRLIDKEYKGYSYNPSKIYFVDNNNKLMIIEKNRIREFDLNNLTSNYYKFGDIKFSALSRDRSQLALIKQTSNDQDIYIFNINSKLFTKVTNSPTVIKRGLSFSNDGLSLVYSTYFSTNSPYFLTYSTIETVNLSSGLVTEIIRTNNRNTTGSSFLSPVFSYDDSEIFYFSFENKTDNSKPLCKLRSSNNYVISDTAHFSSGLTLSGPNNYIIYDNKEFYPWRMISQNIEQNEKHILSDILFVGACASVSDNGDLVLIGSSNTNHDINLVNINGTNKRFLSSGFQASLASDGSKVVFIYHETIRQ